MLPGTQESTEIEAPSAQTTSARGRPSPPATAPSGKSAPTRISSDLQISGNIRTSGEIHLDGIVNGDVRAHRVVIGEGSTVEGEVLADDVVVNGRVVGKVRGLKVRLTSTARVEGDIVHKTIAIESGAHFEGSVQRSDDPLMLNGTSDQFLAPDFVVASVFLNTDSQKEVEKLTKAAEGFLKYLGYEMELERENAI